MSELKVYGFCSIGDFLYQGTDRGQSSNETLPYYLKSEADKVIANRDCEIKKLNGALDQLLKAKTEQIIHEVIQNTLIYGEGFIRVQDVMELTEHYFCKNDEFFLCGHHPDKIPENVVRPYYLKTEADKVIAELKESVKGLILDNYLKDKKIRHHKYKRCLAMARWCDTKADWYYGIGRSLRDRVEFYIKWHKRWLELAKHYKEMTK